MKQYTKTWLLSFTITALTVTCFILTFLMLFDMNEPGDTSSPETDDIRTPSQGISDDYTNYSDNVGGVSFTEDQITELVRNIYSLDGFIRNLSVDFEDDGTLTVKGKIKDADKLCEMYPELSAYSLILKTIENKEITIEGNIVDNGGMADYEIKGASVGSLRLDKNMLSPFMEDGVFTELFDVEYESVEIFNDSVIFKDGVPAVLQY